MREIMGTTVKKHEIDMLHGSIWNKLPLFALPVAATAILEQLFHASDVAIVGNFTGDMRTAAVAAVGANSPVIGLILNLFIGIALGARVSQEIIGKHGNSAMVEIVFQIEDEETKEKLSRLGVDLSLIHI